MTGTYPGHTPCFMCACQRRCSVPPGRQYAVYSLLLTAHCLLDRRDAPRRSEGHLRHLIIFPCRTLQALAGRYELEAAAYGGAAARLRASIGWPFRSVQPPWEEGTNPPFMEKEIRCGTTHHHHPKTVVVVRIDGVVTVGRARVVTIVVPRAAWQDAGVTRQPQAQLPVLAASCNAISKIALRAKRAGLRYRSPAGNIDQ